MNEQVTAHTQRRETRAGLRVLFVAYGAAHIAKVAPVVRELERRGVGCIVLALTLGFRQALSLGLHPLGYKDFLHLVDEPEKVLEVGRSLLAANSHPDVDSYESVCYLGINYAEWVETHGAEGAQKLYLQGGRRAFKPVRFMGRVLADLKPDAVVSTSSPRSEQAVIEAAVQAGVPSLTMMDSFALPADPYHAHPVRADRVTVLSEVVRDNLVARGMDVQRIKVTGCPGFDSHFGPDVGAAAEAFRNSHGWQGLNVLLWAGGIEEAPGTPEELAGPRLAQAVEARLRAYVAQRPELSLIVRYHPSQYHFFKQRLDQPRVHVSNPTAEPIEVIVRVADTVIVQASTVGYEAGMMGKRVLSLTYSPAVKWTGLDYSKMGYAQAVPNIESLLPALSAPQHGGSAPRLSGDAGPAALRVADAILELVQLRARGTR